MNHLNTNNSITENINPTHIFEALPKEATVKILGYLERKDLVAACLSCKLLNEIADSSPLWKKEINFFKIDIKEHTHKNISIKTTIGKSINQLQLCAKEGDKLLKKGAERPISKDMMEYHLMTNLPYAIQTYRIKLSSYNPYGEQENRNQELIKSLNKGFQATLQLKQLGLKRIDALEKYAPILLQYNEGGENVWKTIALEYLSENNPQRALEIMKAELQNYPVEAGSILEAVVTYYAKQNLLDKAIDVIKNYKETNKNFMETYLHVCNSTIFSLAEKSKNFFIMEKMIDTCFPEHNKFQVVHYLIENILNLKNVTEAERLFIKNKNVIASCKDKFHVHQAITLYVRFGHIESAWRTALKYQEKDDQILHVLRNTFSSASLIDEVEKVQIMIDNNK